MHILDKQAIFNQFAPILRNNIWDVVFFLGACLDWSQSKVVSQTDRQRAESVASPRDDNRLYIHICM